MVVIVIYTVRNHFERVPCCEAVHDMDEQHASRRHQCWPEAEHKNNFTPLLPDWVPALYLNLYLDLQLGDQYMLCRATSDRARYWLASIPRD